MQAIGTLPRPLKVLLGNGPAVTAHANEVGWQFAHVYREAKKVAEISLPGASLVP